MSQSLFSFLSQAFSESQISELNNQKKNLETKIQELQDAKVFLAMPYSAFCPHGLMFGPKQELLQKESAGLRSEGEDLRQKMSALETDIEDTKLEYKGAQEKWEAKEEEQKEMLEVANALYAKDSQAWNEQQTQLNAEKLDLQTKLVSAEGRAEVATLTLDTFKKQGNISEGAQLDQICKLSMEVFFAFGVAFIP